MKSAGAWVFSGRLHDPDTATVVRMSDGEVLTTDGPFVEAKEHLGGFYIIEAEDLDAALVWASKVTAAVGQPIEVRPFAAHRGLTAWATATPHAELDEAEIGRIFREESGRSVAALIRVFGDIDLAEDAVQEAFAVALRKWPARRPAAQPGWLDHHDRPQPRHRPPAPRGARTGAARRGGGARARRRRSRQPEEEGPVPDDRLRLIFTCCHPALSTEAQVALTLRLLGGLSTEEVAGPSWWPSRRWRNVWCAPSARSRPPGSPTACPTDHELPEPPAPRAGRRLPRLQRRADQRQPNRVCAPRRSGWPGSWPRSCPTSRRWPACWRCCS